MPLKSPAPEDDLLRFARKNGASAKEVRNHPDNAGFFKARSPQALHAKDQLFVPEPGKRVSVELEAGRTHVLVYAPPLRVLRLTLRDDDGRLLSADYTLSELTYDDTADGTEPRELHGYAHEGELQEELPGSVLTAKLTVHGHEELSRTLSVARLDPVTTPTGLRGRLGLLGLYPASLLGEAEVDACLLRRAIATFQRREQRVATGHADLATRQLLLDLCGV